MPVINQILSELSLFLVTMTAAILMTILLKPLFSHSKLKPKVKKYILIETYILVRILSAILISDLMLMSVISQIIFIVSISIIYALWQRPYICKLMPFIISAVWIFIIYSQLPTTHTPKFLSILILRPVFLCLCVLHRIWFLKSKKKSTYPNKQNTNLHHNSSIQDVDRVEYQNTDTQSTYSHSTTPKYQNKNVQNTRPHSGTRKYHTFNNTHFDKKDTTQMILDNPQHFYHKKSSCMNSNEARMFYYITNALDELIPNKKERNSYYVFPQVSLHAFINLNEELEQNINDSEKKETALKRLLPKNTDFLICKCIKKYYKPSSSNAKAIYSYYEYQPFLMIEIDGSSHSSPYRYGMENFKHQKANDAFKDSISKALNIPLLRYPLTYDTVRKSDYDNLKEQLKNFYC